MKLRNKKTGEIGNLVLNVNSNRESFSVLSTKNGDTICGNLVIADYDSLEELNEEWEDYKEQKEHWFVDSGGEVEGATYLTDNDKSSLRSFGNYFETEEEAEKAIEKLKAWKRLKDKGFKFTDFARVNNYTSMIRTTFDESWSNIYDDLELLFGGEE